MDLKSTYNKIAEDWFKDHHQDTWWQEGTEKFLAELPKGATILDVGCGAGVKSRYLRDKGFKVTGVDFSEKLIEIAKRESPEISFNIIDIYKLDELDQTFDAVFAQASLLHISKNRIKEVLGKIKEKIHPNGFLYIAVKGIRDDGVQEEIKTENDYGYDYQRFFSYYSLPELEVYLKELDMEIIWQATNRVGKTDWLQIIAKRN